MDPRKSRNALARFLTGVVVATARTQAGDLVGMTMSSFNSVSLDPPLVLFSIHRKAQSFTAWQSITRYAVNVLNEEQEQVSNQFARPSGNKWEGLTILTGRNGAPTLLNAGVVFECESYARYDGGDHEIFVGRVEALHEHAFTCQRPLVFFEGRYRQLASAASTHIPPPEAELLHGW
jgi:flavin reductase (DIM6/NTAB) family NADH-FMN oxidoreductase RutF